MFVTKGCISAGNVGRIGPFLQNIQDSPFFWERILSSLSQGSHSHAMLFLNGFPRRYAMVPLGAISEKNIDEFGLGFQNYSGLPKWPIMSGLFVPQVSKLETNDIEFPLGSSELQNGNCVQVYLVDISMSFGSATVEMLLKHLFSPALIRIPPLNNTIFNRQMCVCVCVYKHVINCSYCSKIIRHKEDRCPGQRSHSGVIFLTLWKISLFLSECYSG